MPTGPKHYRTNDDGSYEQCRCMIGEDHGDSEVEESLSVEDAADIWLSAWTRTTRSASARMN
jgi:hypothetical protein